MVLEIEKLDFSMLSVGGWMRSPFRGEKTAMWSLSTETACRWFSWAPCYRWEDGTSGSQPPLFLPVPHAHLVAGCGSLAQPLVLWTILGAFPLLWIAAWHCTGNPQIKYNRAMNRTGGGVGLTTWGCTRGGKILLESAHFPPGFL